MELGEKPVIALLVCFADGTLTRLTVTTSFGITFKLV